MTTRTIKIALIGNPNSGKSTLFNALSGLRQHVGNYPGVTVEMKRGKFTHAGIECEILDLPGTYSLAPRSPDEMVAVDLLLGQRPEESRPDLILSIVDASNLDRHLYLTTQLMEIGPPVVLVVNMVDVAKSQGITVDVKQLQADTGLPVVAIQANHGVGLDELKDTIRRVADEKHVPHEGVKLPDIVAVETLALREKLDGTIPDYVVRRLLFDVGGYAELGLTERFGKSLGEHVVAARARLMEAGCAVPALEAKARYAWIRAATSKAVIKPKTRPTTISDRIDRVLTHKIWGTAVFLLVMFVIFQSIFVGAEPLKNVLDSGIKWTCSLTEANLSPGPFRALLSDGVLRGVGGVIAFLPQILILFGFIAILEDCGYMARAAFLMDRLMSRCGLSGKSFIPLLSSVACAVPGIMATRVIENRRDRLATILVAPLMSCSARLPVYTLLIGAFLRDGRPFWVPGLTLFGLYMIGFITAPIVALILKRTLLRGAPPIFVMELPAYKRPGFRTVFQRMYDSARAFTVRAGTVILASMVLVWALLYFPNTDVDGRSYETIVEEKRVEIEKTEDSVRKAELEHESAAIRAQWKRDSLLGQAGRAMEPVFEPLGWDWRIGMAAMASFPAREVIVGTLGIIFEVGDVSDDDDDEGEKKQTQLRDAIKEQWRTDPVRGKYPVAVALSLMVFFALCCQCASTLAVIRRETNGWKWPAFTFVYMTVLAYVAAWFTFHVAKFITDAT